MIVELPHDWWNHPVCALAHPPLLDYLPAGRTSLLALTTPCESARSRAGTLQECTRERRHLGTRFSKLVPLAAGNLT